MGLSDARLALLHHAEAPAAPPSPLFYYRDSATGHLMQLGRRAAVLPRPATDMEDMDTGDSEVEWITRDLTALLKGKFVIIFLHHALWRAGHRSTRV